jgi:hypothetical protein
MIVPAMAIARQSVRAGLALGALLSLGGCDGIVQTLSAFIPSTPSGEVMALLPVPADARIESAECAGIPRRQGFTCVVQAESAVAMETGAEQAARAMGGWKEFSWDWVPGRIQSSWTRPQETVAIAIHENGAASQWSLTYVWGDYPNPLAEGPYRNVSPQADARLPDALASLPVPRNATLLQASSVTGRPNAQAVFAVQGDPAAILAPFQTMDGWQKTLSARAPWAFAAGSRRDAKEVVATVWVGEDGKHTLVLVSQPAG